MELVGGDSPLGPSQSDHNVLYALIDRLDTLKEKSFIFMLQWIRQYIQEYGNSLTMEFTILLEILLKFIHRQGQLKKRMEPNLTSTLADIARRLHALQPYNIFIDTALLFRIMIPVRLQIPEEEILECLDRMEWSPMEESGLKNLELLVKFFFMKEQRHTLRIRVLDMLKPLFATYHDVCGDKLLRSTISYIKNAYKDDDSIVVGHFLDLYFWICDIWTLPSFYTIMEFIIQPIDKSDLPILTKRMIGNQLNRLFANRISTPYITHTIFLYNKLLEIMSHSDYFIRGETVKTLLSLRGTEDGMLIFQNQMCPFIKYEASLAPSSPHLKTLSIGDLMVQVRERIKKEDSSEVFSLLIQGLIAFLKNKHIMKGIDLSPLLTLLCRLLENRIFGFFVRHRRDANEVKIENLLLGYEVLLCSLIYLPIHHEIHTLILTTLTISIEERVKTEVLEDRLLKTSIHGLMQCAIMETPAFIKSLPSLLEKIERLMLSDKMSFKLDSMTFILDFITILSHQESSVHVVLNHFKRITRIVLPFLNVERNTPVYIHYAFQVLLGWFNLLDSKAKLLNLESLKSAIEPLISRELPWIHEANLDILATMTLLDCDPVKKYSKHEEDMFFPSSEEDLQRDRVWTQGHIVIDIKTNSYGWSRIIMRRPSCKLTWMMQIDNHLRNLSSSLTSHLSYTMDPLAFITRHILDEDKSNSEELKLMKERVFRDRMPTSPVLSPLISRGNQDTTLEEPMSLWHPFIEDHALPHHESVLDAPLSPRNQRRSSEWHWTSSTGQGTSEEPLVHSDELIKRVSQERIQGREDMNIPTPSAPQQCPSTNPSGEDEIDFVVTKEHDRKEMGRSRSDENVPIKERLKLDKSKETDIPPEDLEARSEKLFKRSTRGSASKRSSSFSRPLPSEITTFLEDFKSFQISKGKFGDPHRISEDSDSLEQGREMNVSSESRKGLNLSNEDRYTINPEFVKSHSAESSKEHNSEIDSSTHGTSESTTNRQLHPHQTLRRQSSQEIRGRSRQNSRSSLSPSSSSTSLTVNEEDSVPVVHPSFVFFHVNQMPSTMFNTKLISAHKSKSVRNHIIALDHIHPFETFKVGVLYIPKSIDGDEILELYTQRPIGSIHYLQFIEQLGSWIPLNDVNPTETYTGDLTESDGNVAVVHKERLYQLAFIISNLLHGTDVSHYFKGLDVSILWWDGYYTESTSPDFELFESQLTPISIWIISVDKEYYRVELYGVDAMDIPLTYHRMVVHESFLIPWIKFLSVRVLWYQRNKEEYGNETASSIYSNFMHRVKKVNEIRSKILTEKKIRSKHKFQRQHSM